MVPRNAFEEYLCALVGELAGVRQVFLADAEKSPLDQDEPHHPHEHGGCHRGIDVFAKQALLLPHLDAAFHELSRGRIARLEGREAHPERHRDLVVRVSGYCAYFTDLGSSIQDDIIARTVFGDIT